MTKRLRSDEVVHLLDSNVLFALVDTSHVHHAAAQQWFGGHIGLFATCPITQGTLLRLLGAMDSAAAMQTLQLVIAHPRHRFWVETLDYTQIAWRGIMGHRQVTDAYLAAMARHHRGRLASFDRGLVALHADVAVGLESA